MKFGMVIFVSISEIINTLTKRKLSSSIRMNMIGETYQHSQIFKVYSGLVKPARSMRNLQPRGLCEEYINMQN